MYNRYMRNDAGDHRRADARRNEPPHSSGNHQQRAGAHECRQQGTGTAMTGGLFGKDGPFSAILGKLNLTDLDTGDLLLLLLIFLLFREGGDEELLIALGLLLIM